MRSQERKRFQKVFPHAQGTNMTEQICTRKHEALQGETSCTKLSCCSLPDNHLGPEDTAMNEPGGVQSLMGLIRR